MIDAQVTGGDLFCWWLGALCAPGWRVVWVGVYTVPGGLAPVPPLQLEQCAEITVRVCCLGGAAGASFCSPVRAAPGALAS